MPVVFQTREVHVECDEKLPGAVVQFPGNTPAFHVLSLKQAAGEFLYFLVPVFEFCGPQLDSGLEIFVNGSEFFPRVFRFARLSPSFSLRLPHPEQGIDGGQQFLSVDRLGEIGICPAIEPTNFVRWLEGAVGVFFVGVAGRLALAQAR